MYKCEKCGKVSAPRDKCSFKVVQTRPKKYQNTETGEFTYGSEIVKEEKRCSKCKD